MKTTFAEKQMRGRAFTLIELLVVIAIIALLLSIIVPSLRLAKEQARKVICSSNLSQVGKALEMYVMHNGYKRISIREADEMANTINEYWMGRLAPYFNDDQYASNSGNQRQIGALLCPSAPAAKFDPASQASAGPVGIWGRVNAPWAWAGGDATNTTLGSYGLNGFVAFDQMYEGQLKALLYSDWMNIQGNVPVLGDCVWAAVWPKGTDPVPPDLSGAPGSAGSMSRYCIDRHNKAINLLYKDLRVETVPLTELWDKSWHKDYVPPKTRITLPQ